ncbi:glycosyltransferase family 4 protein [Pseudomonas sp. MWU16-30317]|uniref:MraY family glycosyltransferase n=1 Tax=Pseudomonas sp. MWU16-30317 TaxID=2878095 RepID=UPI001CFC19E2|nr:glycosyltransferase family 4 protein [Pseudomonas sp. MWU16-30317]
MILVVMGALLSWGLTGLVRQYALKRSVMDIPNERSSHSVPTPRGGGVAIVLTFLLGAAMFYSMGLLNTSFFVGCCGAGALIAAIGFLDDHGHIPARWRLLGHFAAAIWALIWLGGMPPIKLFGLTFSMGWAGHVLAVLYLVWLLNLYNFMDGIDGIASIEAISVCLGACSLYGISGQSSLAIVPLFLAAVVVGFLMWNFPPAKIFMGDAGSGFLGIVLGILSLQGASQAPEFFCSWLILLGVFIVDATFTLIRRLVRGDRVYEAHRSHGYQYASRKFGSHRTVILAVAVINMVWLVPLAICVVMKWLPGIGGLALAYGPLLLMAIKYHSGELERL